MNYSIDLTMIDISKVLHQQMNRNAERTCPELGQSTPVQFQQLLAGIARSPSGAA